MPLVWSSSRVRFGPSSWTIATSATPKSAGARKLISAGRDIRQEVEDLSQEVFLQLFAEGGRVLATWQPERGLTLLNFVGLVDPSKPPAALTDYLL